MRQRISETRDRKRNCSWQWSYTTIDKLLSIGWFVVQTSRRRWNYIYVLMFSITKMFSNKRWMGGNGVTEPWVNVKHPAMIKFRSNRKEWCRDVNSRSSCKWCALWPILPFSFLSFSIICFSLSSSELYTFQSMLCTSFKMKNYTVNVRSVWIQH